MTISLLQQPLSTSSAPQITRACSIDERTLPSLTQDFAGRASTPSTTRSSSSLPSITAPPPHRHGSVQLPGLAALASIASGQSPVESNRSPQEFNNMSFATAAPGQTNGAANSVPPVCQNCETTTTPLWRRDESGSVLCNACGLFFKLHGRPRPISLKTNVIKSRNRVKATGPAGGQKRKLPMPGPGLAAAHPDLSNPHQQQHFDSPNRRASSPLLRPPQQPTRSRSLTPNSSVYPPLPHHSSRGQDPSNIAPQHLFDSSTTAAGNPTTFESGRHESLPPMRDTPTPGNGYRSSNGRASSSVEMMTGQEKLDLVRERNELKTRVSEMEIVNELFRGRVRELEDGEARSKREIDELNARLARLENGEREGKRMRLSEGGQ